MYLYIVRHGQSVWNAEEKHQGWQDVPLSPLGEQQAERTGQRLKDIKFDYYFTSPIYRCYQTASAIVRAQGLDPESTLQKREGLKEGRLSASMEGMLVKDMVKSWTKEQRDAFRDDYTFKFDDGESVQGIIERTLVAFNEIAMLSEDAPPEAEEADNAGARDVAPGAVAPDSKPEEAAKPKIVPKNALVVVHRINAQIFLLHGLDALDSIARRQTNIDRLDVSNCGVCVMQVNIKGKNPLFQVLTVNDTNHLAGLKAPPKPAETEQKA